jgi:hypothetical protein
MPTQLLSIGPPQTLLANVVYALPGVKTTMFTDAAAPTIAVSNTLPFTLSIPVVLTNGAAVLGGGFIRATANTVVTLKRD